jgi:hypothetical protein
MEKKKKKIMSGILFIPIYIYNNDPDIIGVYTNYAEMISETIKVISEDLGKHDDVITNWHETNMILINYVVQNYIW